MRRDVLPGVLVPERRHAHDVRGSTWTPGTNVKTADDGFGAGGPTSCATAPTCAIVDLGGNGYTYAVPDTLATQASLTGLATAGSTITLTPGTASSPDVSVVDSFGRCLGGCATLSGTPYTTTAADIGANIQDFRADQGGP